MPMAWKATGSTRVGDIVVEHVDTLAVGDFHHLVEQIVCGVIDAMIGAELHADFEAVIGPGNSDDTGADHVLGDLNADGAEIAAGAHDQHGLAGFQLGDVKEQIPRRRHVAHDDGSAMKVECIGERRPRRRPVP